MAVWSETTTAASPGTIHDMLWASGLALFVAVGHTGAILTSPDGVTWTARTAPEANQWWGLAWSGSLLVAVSSNGVHRVMTSPDGIAWTARTASDAASWQAVCWASALNLFVAVASSRSGGHDVMTSADGITWTGHTSTANVGWQAVCWSPSLARLCAIASGNIMTSADGSTWTARTMPANTKTGGTATGNSALCWSTALSLFAFVGLDSVSLVNWSLVTSPDGITWTTHAIPHDTDALGGVCAVTAGSDRFMAVGMSTDRVVTSPDGSTWSEATTGFSRLWDPAAWSDTLSLFVSWDGLASDTMLLGSFAAPTLTSVTPVHGPVAGDTVITLGGTGLNGVVQGDVLVDGSAAADVRAAADGLTVTAITPAHAIGVVDVSISGVDTLADAFTYTNLTGITPDTGPTVGGTEIALSGYGFEYATGVLIDGLPATSWTIDSGRLIRATVPTHAAGAVDVTVTGIGTLPAAYTYTFTMHATISGVVLLDPLPRLPVVQQTDLARWLTAIKQRIESLPSPSGFSATLTMSTTAVTQPLVGDVTTTVGGVVTTLADTGVAADTYGDSTHIPQITVDAKGRITAASDIAAATGLTQLTGDVTAGPGTGSQVATLAVSGVTAATYGDATHVPQIAVDAKGRITSASNVVISASGSGVVVQVVNTETGAVATGTTVIPLDDTIPQSSEGTQFLSQAITPTSSTNKLRIDISVFVSASGTPWIIAALFQDSTASAVATTAAFNSTATGGLTIAFSHTMTAGTTSATTFKVRIGPSFGPNTITINGQGGGRLFGGVAASSLTITEYTP
jgi:hypothetical protein